MAENKVYTAIGLMAGTSLDGIDVALLRTDGHAFVEPSDFLTVAYPPALREAIRACFGRRDDVDRMVARVEAEITRAHAAAVAELLAQTGRVAAAIDLIGFHGQTISHDPAARFTWQIGDGALLAQLTGIDVINDMRKADVLAGGQGAPLLPLYHQARAHAAGLASPLAILNFGGIGNVTYLGPEEEILAFDTGPGNAMLNDWVQLHLSWEYDRDGLLARSGTVDQNILNNLLSHAYFTKQPPKSLDRNAWLANAVNGLSPADGAATLTAFTVQAVVRGAAWFAASPRQWLITGGGRRNIFLMEELALAVQAPVRPVEAIGWNGDALESEGFAYLAVRSVLGLPLSLPTTTGVPSAMTGGRFYKF